MIKKLNLSESVAKALKNVNWLLFEKAISMPLSLIISIVLARYLGAEQFGVYNYLLSLIYLVAPLSAMGLNALITREIVDKPSSQQSTLGAGILGRLLASAISFLLLFAYSFWLSADQQQWLILLAVAQMFSVLTLLDFWFQAHLKVKFSVLARLLSTAILFFIRLGAVMSQASLEVFVWLFALELVLVACLFLAFYMTNAGNPLKWQFDWRHTWGLLKQSYLLVLSGVAAAIYLRIDIVMLSDLVSDETAGIYAVASRISEIWYFIPVAIVSSFFPMLLKNKRRDSATYQHNLQKLCNILFCLSLVILIPVSLLAELIVSVLYGELYIEAAAILTIHVFAGIFIFIRALLSKWLIAENLLIFSLVSQCLGAITNVLLNLALIPEFGAQGAAWATLVSYAFASYFALALSSQTWPMMGIMTRSFYSPLTLCLSVFTAKKV